MLIIAAKIAANKKPPTRGWNKTWLITINSVSGSSNLMCFSEINAIPVKPTPTAPSKPTAIQLIPKRLALGNNL